MDYSVNVVNIAETRVLNNQNQPERALRFTFKVGAHGPFTLDFLPTEVQDGTARLKMNEFARQLQVAAM